MRHPHRHGDQCRRQQSPRHRMPGMQVGHPFAKHDVSAPPHGGGQGIHHTHRVERTAAVPQRQQQGQACDGQRHPDKVHHPARRPDRHRQRARKFDGDRNAERNGAQRHIKRQVGQPQSPAIQRNGPGIHPRQRPAPGPPEQQQNQRRETHTDSGGAGGSDQREQRVFGP